MIDFNKWAKTARSVGQNLPTVQTETRETLLQIAEFLDSLVEPKPAVSIAALGKLGQEKPPSRSEDKKEKTEKKEEQEEKTTYRRETGPPRLILSLEDPCDD